MNDSIKLEAAWKERLLPEFSKPYMQKLKKFLHDEYKKKKIIYPKGSEFFSALNTTPFEKVKVVIIGQDPYHGLNQAHGLCFSVLKGIDAPPSLLNIFKEMHSDLGLAAENFPHGNLSKWAEQGVLLLNSVLSVEKSRAASHQGRGWEEFTDTIIRELNENREHVVFMLWGTYAQKKGQFIDKKKHMVLTAPHPSPLSSYRGFFGCKHFSKANKYLAANGLEPIDWRLYSG
ncbi:MAG: uracil-DNA glycosylase [Pseudomonadota bacterium]|nr:uracil-DNA glycosylase [Pseudomonadota bacterium]